MGEQPTQRMERRVNWFLLKVANALTLARLCGAPVLIWVLLQTPLDRRFDWIAIGVILGLQTTDVLDGWLARRAKPDIHARVNPTGEMLDPVADKLYMNGAYITLMALGRVPLWAGGFVVARDLLILLGWIAAYLRSGVRLLPNLLGKAADSVQALALLMVLALPDNTVSTALLVLVAGLTVVSGVSYAKNALAPPQQA
ncbi:MAG: hypothetical protein GC160_28575 [Acidobacteria bacterium]|nr:hypothetical protein [Acidobacteriota bacterium]